MVVENYVGWSRHGNGHGRKSLNGHCITVLIYDLNIAPYTMIDSTPLRHHRGTYFGVHNFTCDYLDLSNMIMTILSTTSTTTTTGPHAQLPRYINIKGYHLGWANRISFYSSHRIHDASTVMMV